MEAHRGTQAMYYIASAESLIGSTWAAFACLAIGYIAGHIVPLGTIAGWIRGAKG